MTNVITRHTVNYNVKSTGQSYKHIYMLGKELYSAVLFYEESKLWETAYFEVKTNSIELFCNWGSEESAINDMERTIRYYGHSVQPSHAIDFPLAIHKMKERQYVAC